MAISTTIAGAYTGTLAASAIGFLDDDGFQLELNTEGELVQNTDIFGGTILDIIHRGANAHLTFSAMVYGTVPRAGFNPWGAFGIIATTAAPLGRLGSAVASAMVMTVVASTPAAAAPATLTASKAILPPNSNLKLLYTTKVRKVPLRMLLLPSESGGSVSHWAETAIVYGMSAATLLMALGAGLFA